MVARLNPTAGAGDTQRKTPPDRKQCIHCRQSKPRDAKHFPKDPKMRDGLANRCKECAKKARRSKQPSQNGSNGRGPGGRFAKGNPGGPGNPLARQVQALRVALVNAVTPKDIGAMVKRLTRQAKKGDVASAKVLFDRCMGQIQALDLDIRLEALETRVYKKGQK